jgi:2-haloacid dehalogenase
VPGAFGVPPEETLFVSSNRWDVAGAAAFGFMPLWVNRAGLPDEYPGLEPVAVVGDLGALIG